jgi:UDP-N-acetylmuramate--alanine ligase
MMMFVSCEDCVVIHFVGIGGAGVSGLAEILHSLGYVVQGSDVSYSQNVGRLEKLGITVFIGHDAQNINGANVVVYSSAIKVENPELSRAKELKIPCLTRAEMLSQVVRLKKSVVTSGSHGKTTTTSICAAILEAAALDPTVINGGVINSYGTNAKLGSGDWAVIESDESDGSFVSLFPTIGIITNIDIEHIGHYGSFEKLKCAFKAFLENLPFYGVGIVCIDDDNVLDIVKDATNRRILTYSIKRGSMFRAVNIRKSERGTIFDVQRNGCVIEGVEIPLFGDHNVLNSLAAFAMAIELKVDEAIVKSALSSFGGVCRRFTHIGDVMDVVMIDDYAHHPTEIRSLIVAARQRVGGKVVIVCQPHRFTRLSNLFDEFCRCFDGADITVITPVYKADDLEKGNISSKDLYEALVKEGRNALFANNEDELTELVKGFIENKVVVSGDAILFAGAGSISKWAHNTYSSCLKAFAAHTVAHVT